MAMRRQCEAPDHVVSRLPFAAQRLAPVDALLVSMSERRHLPVGLVAHRGFLRRTTGSVGGKVFR
jgi:hypothetical protein